MHRRARAMALLLLVAPLAAGACADDEEERLSAAELTEELAAACQEVNEALEDLEEDGDEPANQADAAAQTADATAEALGGFVETTRDLEPPDDLEDELNELVGIIEDAQGEFAAVAGTPEAEREQAVQDAFTTLGRAEAAAEPLGLSPLETCGEEEAVEAPAEGAQQVAVTATEYAFALQGAVPAGPVAFVMQNAGQEPHFMALVRLVEGATSAEVIQAEQKGEDSDQYIEAEIGDSNTAVAGQQAVLNAELEPGTYGMACFVSAPDGQPHAFKGMHVTIQVEGAAPTTAP